MAEFPRGVVKSSLILMLKDSIYLKVLNYFFLHMDMFQDEVSVLGSKIATLREKRIPQFETFPYVYFYSMFEA